MIYLSAGQAQPNVLEPPAEDSPLLFLEKQIIQVDIENVYVEGGSAIPYTYCEVYAPSDINTMVWRNIYSIQYKYSLYVFRFLTILSALRNRP